MIEKDRREGNLESGKVELEIGERPCAEEADGRKQPREQSKRVVREVRGIPSPREIKHTSTSSTPFPPNPTPSPAQDSTAAVPI